jgi:hypothetical protein
MANDRDFSKNAGSQSGGRKRIMRALVLKEISGVDTPAQEGARAVIMKRAGEPVQDELKTGSTAKRAALTTAVDGHAHSLMLDWGHGMATSGETNYVDGHSHPWVMLEDGSIQLGEVKGHTHDIATIGKVADPSEEPDMADNKTPEVVKTEADARVAELEAQLAKANKIAGLTGDIRAYFDGLDETAKSAFLEKSAEDQAAAVKAAKSQVEDEDPVVYKSADGQEFRKSDDPRIVALAKRADEQAKRADKAEAAQRDGELEKRAAALTHIPGDLDVRKSMLNAIDGIPDEAQRTRALEALKAQDAALGVAFKNAGVRSGATADVAGSPEAELDTLAKAYANENKVTVEQAYDKVLQTPRGAELYAQTTAQ